MSLEDIEIRFTWNQRRRRLFVGLRQALANLAQAGVKKVWINGSFVTAEDDPNDIDGCWEYESSVDVDRLDVAFLDLNPPRATMKRKYGVDFLISGATLADAGNRSVEEFFQIDREGNPKGILLLELTR